MTKDRDPSAGQTSRPQSSATSSTGFEPTRSSDESFAPPVVSLSKGGGAILGIGEKFGVNSANGTGTLTIPLPVSPRREPAPVLARSSRRKTFMEFVCLI